MQDVLQNAQKIRVSRKPQKLARYFDFGDVKMSGQMRERVLQAMKIRKMTFAELAVEALQIRVNQIIKSGSKFSSEVNPEALSGRFQP
jgi:hypothetical protein